jgi:hypothetical protein
VPSQYETRCPYEGSEDGKEFPSIPTLPQALYLDKFTREL